jgi:hypothetical protein
MIFFNYNNNYFFNLINLPTAQARKANDSATVEQIKQHFQRQIQEMLQSQQRHERQQGGQLRLDPPPEFAANRPPHPWSAPISGPAKLAAAAATAAPNKMAMSSPPPPPPSSGVLLKTNTPTTPALSIVSSSMQQQQQTDIVNFSNMQRGKSFLEARSAVQRQIEKMFIEANEDGASSGNGGGKLSPGGIIKHTMHGVSHIAPEDEDKYCTPPPVHYGVQEALRSRRESAGGDRLSPPAPRTESKTEKFNSQRSTTVGGYNRGGLDTSLAGSVSSVGVAGAKTIVDLGNIDIMRRKSTTTTAGGITTANHHRRSATEESLAAQVRLRERSREEQANIRRISVHQDSFDFTPTDDGEDSSSGVHQLRTPLAASSPLLTTTTATAGRLQQQPTAAAAAPAGARGAGAGPKPPAKAKPVRYRIEYLGAVPLRTKASNLDALQV